MFVRNDHIQELLERVKGLEREAEMMRTIMIVKEPGSVQAAQSFDGLRKQVLAGAAERRSHLAQLVAMSVAVSRAATVDDLVPQVREWMAQAGVGQLDELPSGAAAKDLFEDVGRDGLAGGIEVLEPAYVDLETGALLRLGRARAARPASPTAVQPPEDAPAPDKSTIDTAPEETR